MIRRAPVVLAAVLLTIACGALIVGVTSTQADVVVQSDVVYGTAGGSSLLLDIYKPALPSGSGPPPAVVFVHGGGFTSGSKKDWKTGANLMATGGWVGVSVDYRLAPAATYPAPADDVVSALNWMGAHAASVGFDPRRVVLVGDSAGGLLAASAAERLSSERSPAVVVHGVVSWSGLMDLTTLAATSSGHLAASYLGCSVSLCPETYRAASPTANVSQSTPPMLLFNSSDEFILRSQPDEMAARLDAAGSAGQVQILAGQRHGVEYGNDAWPGTVTFIEQVLGSDLEAREGVSWPWVIGSLAGAAAILIGRIVWRLRRRPARRPA